MVQEFINDMMIKSPLGTKPLARATVVGIRRDLNVFLRKAVALKYIPSNPVEGTRIPRATKNLDEEKAVILTRQQVQELLAFVKGTPQECWYSLIIDGTLRRGEALGLLWDDVDFEKSIIKIRNNWTEGADGVEMTSPKSLSSIRSIKLTQNTMRLLKKEHVRYKQCKVYSAIALCILTAFCSVFFVIFGWHDFNFSGMFFFMHVINPVVVLAMYLFTTKLELKDKTDYVRRIFIAPAFVVSYALFDYIRFLITGDLVYGLVSAENLTFINAFIIGVCFYASIAFMSYGLLELKLYVQKKMEEKTNLLNT